MARPEDTGRVANEVLAVLRRQGWLLQADAALPSVATLVAGEPVTGSWWAHPASNRIHWVLEELEAQPDVLQVKLIKRKLTLVHRSLWPELFAAADAVGRRTARTASAPARSLLTRTRRAGSLRLDRLRAWRFDAKPGAAARELEIGLCVHAREIHTESGRHTKELSTWEHLRTRLQLDAPPLDPAHAMRVLESRIAPHGEGKRLPW